MGIPDSVRLKLNGTFKRDLYLLDESNRVYLVTYKIQTALWFDSETGKWQYVSIFPNFIRRYCPFSYDLLEYISCHTGKGENIFRHIDDPENFFDCEDTIVRTMQRMERNFQISKFSDLLVSKYAEEHSTPIPIVAQEGNIRRFSAVFNLILIARELFRIEIGVLSLTNAILQL